MPTVKATTFTVKPQSLATYEESTTQFFFIGIDDPILSECVIQKSIRVPIGWSGRIQKAVELTRFEFGAQLFFQKKNRDCISTRTWLEPGPFRKLLSARTGPFTLQPLRRHPRKEENYIPS